MNIKVAYAIILTLAIALVSCEPEGRKSTYSESKPQVEASQPLSAYEMSDEDEADDTEYEYVYDDYNQTLEQIKIFTLNNKEINHAEDEKGINFWLKSGVEVKDRYIVSTGSAVLIIYHYTKIAKIDPNAESESTPADSGHPANAESGKDPKSATDKKGAAK